MKADKRYLAAVSVLGKGHFTGPSGYATDGHTIMSEHRFEGETREDPRILDGPQAKEMLAQVKAWKVDSVILDPEHQLPGGKAISDQELENMQAAYAGTSLATFCVDWKLMEKAVKILTAADKASDREPVLCSLFPITRHDKTVMFFLMQKRGKPDVLVYVAGMYDQTPAREEGEALENSSEVCDEEESEGD
jgi:hypothetical protein